jgi:hypothetical protein
VTWDLNGAVQLLWNDPTLHAYPMFNDTSIVCQRTSLYPYGYGYAKNNSQAADYGHALFVDLRTGQQTLVRSQQECRAAAHEFKPGPVFGTAPFTS